MFRVQLSVVWSRIRAVSAFWRGGAYNLCRTPQTSRMRLPGSSIGWTGYCLASVGFSYERLAGFPVSGFGRKRAVMASNRQGPFQS